MRVRGGRRGYEGNRALREINVDTLVSTSTGVKRYTGSSV